MIYKWFFSFSSSYNFFNLFQYITFRSFLSFFTAFFVCWFLGYIFISKTKGSGLGERVNSDSPSSHKRKEGIPTMGGIFILLGFFTTCLLWVNLFEPLVLATLALVFGFALVGSWDDWLKLKRKDFRGLRPFFRLGLEFLFCIVILSILVFRGEIDTSLYFPILKNWVLIWVGFMFFLELLLSQVVPML